MVVAIASAVFGWVNLQRARSSDAAAQASRSEAEKLVGFLIEDFYAELEPTGRLDTLGKLAHKTVSYYDGLPAQLVTARTRGYRAMALVREAEALNGSGNFDAARRNLLEGQRVFQALYDGGDHGDGVVLGLAQATYDLGTGGTGSANRSDAALLTKAADLLRPLVHAPNGPRAAKLLYANTLNYLSHTQPKALGVTTCEEARAVLKGLGALDLTDLNAASAYADVADSEARHLLSLGRVDEAQGLEQEVYDLAEKVLAQRPNDLRSLGNRYYAAQLLGALAERRHDEARATEYAVRALNAGEDTVRFNPADMTSWVFYVGGMAQVSNLQQERGEVGKALASMHDTMALAQDPRRPGNLGPVLWNRWAPLAVLQARAGDRAGAERSLQALGPDLDALIATFEAGDVRRELFATGTRVLRARLQLFADQNEAALANAKAVADLLGKAKPEGNGAAAVIVRDNLLRNALRTAAWAALRAGHDAEAETLARRWLAVPPDLTSNIDPLAEPMRARAVAAVVMARQGKGAEAQAMLQPALDYYAKEYKAGANYVSFRFDYGHALYASTLPGGANADGARRAAALATAAALIDGAGEAKDLWDMRELAKLVAAARAGRAG
jgi:hypothetical protein